MKRTVILIFTIFVTLYVLICLLLYSFQEKLIFFPNKLNKKYSFKFEEEFQELNIKVSNREAINGLLFKADSSRGLIFYLHGNAGNLNSWGNIAKTYTDLNYDIFMLDYRGYGKSDGNIHSQAQVFEDNQLVYNELKKKYKEEEIVILGYSIGTGLASKLASENQPKQLILQAPYYNLTYMMSQRFPFVPSVILKYKFETNEYLKNCEMPITIFHGNNDRVINHTSSLKLKENFSERIELIILKDQGHNGMTYNHEYQEKLKNKLELSI